MVVTFTCLHFVDVAFKCTFYQHDLSFGYHHALSVKLQELMTCLMKVRKLVGPSLMVPLTPRKRRKMVAMRSTTRK